LLEVIVFDKRQLKNFFIDLLAGVQNWEWQNHLHEHFYKSLQ